MPVLEQWDPRPTLKLWFEKERKDYSSVIERKATKAEYFKRIFVGVEEEKDSSDDETAQNVPIQLNRKF